MTKQEVIERIEAIAKLLDELGIPNELSREVVPIQLRVPFKGADGETAGFFRIMLRPELPLRRLLLGWDAYTKDNAWVECSRLVEEDKEPKEGD